MVVLQRIELNDVFLRETIRTRTNENAGISPGVSTEIRGCG
jgi:hypothetical protein